MRRFFLIAILLSSLLVLAVVSAVFLERYLEGVKQDIVLQLEEEISEEFAYRLLSYSGLGRVRLQDLSLIPNQEREKLFASVQDLVLRFNLFSLLAGRNIDSLRQVQLSHLNIDMAMDEGANAVRSGIFDLAEQWGGEIPDDLEVEGRSFQFTFRFPQFVLSAENFSFQAEKVSRDSIRFSARMILNLSSDARAQPEFSSVVDLSFEGDELLSSVVGNVVFSDVQLFSNRITTQSINFLKNGAKLYFTRQNQHNSAFSFGGSVNLAEQRWNTFLDMDDLLLNSLVLKSNPGNLSTLLRYFLDQRVNATIHANGSKGEVFYRGHIDTREEAPQENETSAGASFVADFEGDLETLSIERLSYAALDGEALFTGSLQVEGLLPEGQLSINALRMTPDHAPINGEIALSSSPGVIKLETFRLLCADTTLHGLSATITRADVATILDLEFYEDAARRNRFSGAMQILDDDRLSSQLSIRESRLATLFGILEALPLPSQVYDIGDSIRALPFDLRASLDLAMNIEGEKQEVLLHELRVWEHLHAGDTFLLLSGNFSSPLDALQIGKLQLSVRGNLVSGEGSVTLGPYLSLDGNLRSAGQVYMVQGSFVQDERLELAVFEEVYKEKSLFFELFSSEEEGLVASLEAVAFDLPFAQGNDTVSVSLRSSGVFLGETWSLGLHSFQVFSKQQEELLSFRASLTERGGTVQDIVISGADEPLKGSATLFFDDGRFESIALNLYSDVSNEDLHLEASGTRRGIVASLESKKLALARLAPELPGYLSLSLSYDSQSPLLSGDLSYRYSEDLFIRGSSRLSWDGTRLQISDFQGRYFDRYIEDATLLASLNTHRIEGGYRYRNEASSSRDTETLIRGTLSEDAKTLQDMWTLPFSATLATSSLVSTAEELLFPSVTIVRDQSFIRITDDSRSFFFFRFADESFRFQLEKPPFAYLSGSGTLRDELYASLAVDYLDIGRLGSLSFGEFISFSSGKIDGALVVSGSFSDPYLEGDIQLDGVRGSTAFSPTAFGPARSLLRFEGKSARILPFYFANGDGYGKLEAEFFLDELELERFWFRLESEEEPGLNIHYAFGPVDANGYVTGFIEVGWHRDFGLDILGDIRPRNALFSTSEGGDFPEINIVDLVIRAGRSVVFGWPREGLPVIRCYIVPNDSIHLTADGIHNIQIAGDLRIRGGELLYFNRLFLVRDGNMHFDGGNILLGPSLSVKAEMRERRNGEQVRIYLETENAPVTNLSPTFYSDPPLSSHEIVQLLGSNLYEGEEFSGYFQISDALVSTVSHFGGIDGGFRRFEGFMRETLQLDTFALRTSVVQNLVRGAIVGISEEYAPEVTDSNPYTVSQLLEDTSVTLGRYVGEEVYTELSIRLDAQENEIEQFSEIGVSTEFRMEFDTPFFFLEWFFFPNTPNDFFIPDNRFTLSWKVSY